MRVLVIKNQTIEYDVELKRKKDKYVMVHVRTSSQTEKIAHKYKSTNNYIENIQFMMRGDKHIKQWDMIKLWMLVGCFCVTVAIQRFPFYINFHFHMNGIRNGGKKSKSLCTCYKEIRDLKILQQ